MRKLLLLLLVSVTAGALSWEISGEELRRCHADNLEEVLFRAPFLRLDRKGGAGLPFLLDSGRSEEVLLLLDGMPMRDPWTGENLWSDIPLSLVEKITVRTGSEAVKWGSPAGAGVILVETRRHEEKNSRAWIHVAPVMTGEPEARRFSLETPGGNPALSLGLDEYFRESLHSFGDYSETPASPEPTRSSRRALTLRMDLDAGRAGPLELQLLQSDHALSHVSGKWNRGLYQLSLALPESPWGQWHAIQRFSRHRSELWTSEDAMFELSWRGSFRGIEGGAGLESHLLRASHSGTASTPLGNPARVWAFAEESGSWKQFRVYSGLRAEVDKNASLALLGDLALERDFGENRLRAFVSLGRGQLPWAFDRYDSECQWPWTVTSADSLSDPDFQRLGLHLKRSLGDLHVGLLYRGEVGHRPWSLDSLPSVWRQGGAQDLHSLGLTFRWDAEPLHRFLDAGFSLLSDPAPGAFLLEGSLLADLGESDLRAPFLLKLFLRWEREIARGDGRWVFSLPLEVRGGGELPSTLLMDARAELRILSGSIWASWSNLFNWPLEEVPGFPQSPARFWIGVDWYLDN